MCLTAGEAMQASRANDPAIENRYQPYIAWLSLLIHLRTSSGQWNGSRIVPKRNPGRFISSAIARYPPLDRRSLTLLHRS